MRRKKMSVLIHLSPYDASNASQSLVYPQEAYKSKRNISNYMASTFSLYGLTLNSKVLVFP